MPPEGLPDIPHCEILRLEEILSITSAAASVGINKFRISGGEPLLKKGIIDFLTRLKAQKGTEKVSITTNGILLNKYVSQLASIGLTSLNVSLDTMKSSRMKEITGSGEIDKVLSGIRAAVKSGIPVKINTLLFQEVFDELEALIALSEELRIPIRFIEYMPFDKEAEKRITEHPVKTDALVKKLSEYGALTKTKGPEGSGPSEYYLIEGRKAVIGIIGALTNPFCHNCNRLRLTSDGFIKPCLASPAELNAKAILRNSSDKDETNANLVKLFELAASEKPFAHKMNDGQSPHRNMSRIGG
jgi:cyclic pyranopterin phosphate synthase